MSGEKNNNQAPHIITTKQKEKGRGGEGEPGKAL